ncbi:hypothetical protein, variant 1 [Aphanomyces astaci]|uniref:Uncharacterized protein n=1 Tax=Aphanomyces astaci TaxID=112090 RepID=W4HE69_APHAT|nr:hypothetical protein, variant 1 [Aphanomyces astaci]ETV89589.1 hypothetical protein, variant 1 [Aphanomyces astaci]|eukprot:XP_009821989.1 hypothetical protein, variant 1 [Aphanomyces astaci]
MTTESSHPAIDSRAEKLTRGSLKSRVDHHLNASCVVILDSLNYIKGCRYELFCMAKENSTTHCVVYVDTPVAISQQRNQDRDGDKFPDIMVDAIARRFEEPLEKNRWDSPLIRVLPDVDDTNVSLVLQHIEQVILHGKVTKAGWATQAKPVVETSFLQQLDAITNAIVDDLIGRQRDFDLVDAYQVPQATTKVCIGRPMSASELRRHRRQFIKISQLHPPAIHEIGTHFVDYLNEQA